jgi:hypothetical protein
VASTGAQPRLSAATVAELRTAARHFTPAGASATRTWLRSCGAAAVEDPRVLIAYHDCLLFLLAYPQTAALQAQAERELMRVASAAHRLSEHGPNARWALEDSGVAWSETSPTLSSPIAQWLADRFPDQVELASIADGTPLREILQFCLPAVEEAVLSLEQPPGTLLDRLAGAQGGSKLRWLLDRLAVAPCSREIQEHLFGSMRTFIRIQLRDGPLSRTFARGLPREPFFHRVPLPRDVEPHALVLEPLPPKRRLTRQDRKDLVTAARALLTGMGRETETIRWCRSEAIESFDLDRGLSVVLYPMPPERRLPIDTHVGFMVFKNSLPIAYGGGWPFLGLCRIGIHVFAPYRGTESVFTMSQVLRVYHHRFRCDRFLAEATQFGEGEHEGLTSGAFWFYHRLGFRPVDPRFAKLADAEVARTVGSGRRSPIGLLRRLARSDLELVLPRSDPESGRCDPASLSLAVTDWIGSRFGGDRKRAEGESVRRVTSALGALGIERWPDGEQRSFRDWCLLLALIPGLARWPASDRSKAVAIMRAKGAPNEDKFFDLLRRHRRMCNALMDIASPIASQPDEDPVSVRGPGASVDRSGRGGHAG